MTKLMQPAAYNERVLPSISFYVAGLFLPVALFLVALPFSDLLAVSVALGSYLCLIVVSVLLSPKIFLTSAELQVSRATINLSSLGLATSIPRKEQFIAKGQNLSPLVFTKFQVGVKGLVKIELNDEKDQTPYWLVSTRHPEVLVGHLNAKR
ncbi:MAG: DUF3093 family protein [Actinomycetes bacterium]